VGPLQQALAVVLAEFFCFSLKAQRYHWNTTGPGFYTYHLLFERVYTTVYSEVDRIAEELRGLGSVVPAGLEEFSELSSVESGVGVVSGGAACVVLLDDCAVLLADLHAAALAAQEVVATGGAPAGVAGGCLNLVGDLQESVSQVAYLLRSQG
jgi:starvation-inducible DNA-binding protein